MAAPNRGSYMPLQVDTCYKDMVVTRRIDYFFGWKLQEMQNDMQLHYAGMDHGERLELARVTAMT